MEEEADDVVVGDKEHEPDEQDEEGNEHPLNDAGRDGLFGQHFPERKADVSSVENRNGEKVENP